MNVKKRVVSLEIAKRLAALGVTAESYFSWYQGSPQGEEWIAGHSAWGPPGWGNRLKFAAYTPDELIELLGDEFVLICQKSKGKFQAYSSPERLKIASADTPANALGLLLEEVLNERRGEH